MLNFSSGIAPQLIILTTIIQRMMLIIARISRFAIQGLISDFLLLSMSFCFWLLLYLYLSYFLFRSRLFVDSFLKQSFLFLAIAKPHPPVAMLHSICPFAFVMTTFNPRHLSIPMPFIQFILTLVKISRSPLIYSISILEIIFVPSLIIN